MPNSTDSAVKIHPLPQQDSPLRKEVGQLSVDIYYNDKEIVVIAPVAGVEKDAVHLSVTEDVLVIKGERKIPEEVPEDNYYTKECFWGPFSRSIVLPLEADINEISAQFENNVLTIRIPKSEKEHTKIIKIAA